MEPLRSPFTRPQAGPPAAHGPNRRGFLKAAGGVAGAALLFTGCDLFGHIADGPDDDDPDALDLGIGDIGVLNYAYVLEQLEAAFYARVVAMPFHGITGEERRVFDDLAAHEDIHRLTLRTVLGGNAIPDLQPNFERVDFSDRHSVLGTALTFEDLGVAAYNGAARFISDASILVVAGKIVSVEGRHAAAIRDLMDPEENFFGGTDADGTPVIDENGLDRALVPSEVLPMVLPFLRTPVKAPSLS